MKYFQTRYDSRIHLIAATDERFYDLTSVKPNLRSFRDLAAAVDIANYSLDDLASRLLQTADVIDAQLLESSVLPVVPSEVWAAGVTYKISEEAREAESGMPEMYIDVYDSQRPELFFKATPEHTVGPKVPIGIRSDSNWNVPEPELGIVLYDGSVIGYTIGNDVSSREIEGENPLYLPQAKVYDRCCALGPCVASPETVGDPHDLTISMSIERDETQVYAGETSTGEMKRSCQELVDYWTRCNAIPEVAVLLTGTSLVPDDSFTLRSKDTVQIQIENIGSLVNPVIEV